MKKQLITLIFFLCFLSQAFAQLDEKEAYRAFKKIKGTWIATDTNGKVVYESWQKQHKTSLCFMRYTLQNQDTTLLSKGTVYYSKARILRPSNISYSIYAEGDLVYPFRLYEFRNENEFEFSNYYNQELHKIIYHLKDKRTLTVSYFSKNGSQTHALQFTKK